MQWHETEHWAKERLANAISQIQGDVSELETAKLRGRIAVLKELIALPDTTKLMVAQSKSVRPIAEGETY